MSQALLTLETQYWNKKTIIEFLQPDKGIFISNWTGLSRRSISKLHQNLKISLTVMQVVNVCIQFPEHVFSKCVRCCFTYLIGLSDIYLK